MKEGITMKKYIVMMLTLLFIFTFIAGCKEKSDLEKAAEKVGNAAEDVVKDIDKAAKDLTK